MCIEKYNSAIFPTNDFVFHKVFAKEGNEKITKEFLNTILSNPVDEVRFENPIQIGDSIADKEPVFDIKAVLDEKGIKKLCNIEMQVMNQNNMQHRLPYHWAKMYISQLHKGDLYSSLCKTICILIAVFNLDDDSDFYSEYGILKKNSKCGDKALTEDLEFYIIELPKLRKMLEESKQIDNAKLVSWLKFISNPNELEEREVEETEGLEEALKILDDINSSDYERDMAERRLDWIRSVNDGKKWAREEGEKKAKVDIAKKMLDKNKPINEIIEFTGLTKEEIEALK